MSSVRKARRRGATLLLTLALVAIVGLVLARRMMQTTTLRMASASQVFAVQSQWIADGVAKQWLALSKEANRPVDSLLSAQDWTLDTYQVHIAPSSAQNKLSVIQVPAEDWLPLWRRQDSTITLVENPQRVLSESGLGALDVLLDVQELGARGAYVAPEGKIALADRLTVWGDGKVDLNHASRDILAARFKGWTDAQIDGILRLRARTPISDMDTLADALSLSEDQQQQLTAAATLAPQTVELLIEIRRGPLVAIYHAVVTLGLSGQVLEVRVIN